MSKKLSRIRRAIKTRAKIKRQGQVRLCVHRSSQHIYAQVISADDNSIIASASTLEGTLRDSLTGTKKDKAKEIGKAIGERALKAGIKEVAFDRSGFRYHGRVKALAEGAREAGLEF